MNRIYSTIAFLFLTVSCTMFVQGQSFWNDSSEPTNKSNRDIVPASYRTVNLDIEEIQNYFLSAPHNNNVQVRNSNFLLEIPLPDGSMQSFRIVEAPVMADELTERYPFIRAYAGQGIDDPNATIRFDITHKGFHGMVISNSGTYFIDPYSRNSTEIYISYWKSEFYKTTTKVFNELPPITNDMGMDVQKFDNGVKSKYTKPIHDREVRSFGQRASSGTQLRTYRLALAATGEYVAYHGGTVADGLAAMVTSMVRVNGVYEREVAITMVMVPNNNLLVYTDGGTDPYTNGNGGTMLGENISNCNAVIGSANYDIGHVFSTGGGGVAYLNAPCGSNKAGGVTGSGNPVGDAFDIDYVCHEMGHQFGGNHTQNNSCNRSSGAAYEPGSASTIMGYAGICAPNLQAHSDDYFHNHSYNEIVNFSVNGNGNTCAVITGTGNGVPSVIMPAEGMTIPISTPFELTASGSDPDGDAVTFNWEQYDLGPATAGSDNDLTNPSGNQVIFRSWLATVSPTRVFPRPIDLINNTTTVGEHLPTYTRDMKFKCTIRDNRAGGGGVNDDLVAYSVSDVGGPFLVTTPNTAVTYLGNTIQTITWDVANTNAAPISCSNVDIFLSYDGGYTYPTTLVSNVANDGSQDVLIPAGETTTARIKVKASGNIFFDISNTNFTIGPAAGSNDYDAGITAIPSPTGDYCGDTVTPEVHITNYGTVTLTSFDLDYDYNGGATTTFNWTGSIATGATAIINLPTATIAGGSHTFNASVSNPNGTTDDNPTNNNGSSSFTTITGGTTVTFTLLTDCWGGEVSWDLQDASNTILGSTATGSLGNQTTYSTDFCLASGCYDLTINDSFGDGLSGIASGCAIDGDYNISDEYGNVLVQMGAANYGSNISHNFCVPLGTPGCTNNTACNYDSTATVDDGSCTFPGCTNVSACNYDAAAGCDDGSCTLPDGCTDMTACNYNAAALCDDGSCILPDGCTDNTACNYNASAQCDDGSCILPDGCTDMTACNYNASALCDDGSCILPDGCTDMTACNYNASALCDDGSCILPDGCTDNAACNYNASAQCDDGSCILPDGCTNMTACNYNASALCDDGSCIMPDGCTDMTACNYNASAICDDGSCMLPDGCTNMTACNYNAAALCDDGTCILPDGCTDMTACNYNAAAQCDDGSCILPDGCTDMTACNYNAAALCDDGSCILPDGCTDMTACNYNVAAQCDDGSCILPDGCTDMTACNYNAAAQCDDGSCILPDGCTDMTACNYNAAAQCDDGSCEYVNCSGCTNPLACNYDSLATIDNGSCVLPDGCTDVIACNYNASALCDDGSCIMPDGCTDMTACNYNVSALCDDGSCILPDGCTNMIACNYNALAICDDGSCILPDGCTDMTACNYNASALCDDGSCIIPDGCTDMTACNYNAAALCDDASCILPDGCTDITACNYNASALCDDGSCILPDGCTDMTACNYNVSALCDDGSCILPDGCTDMTACNYNASALCDDGSCILPDGCTDMTACNYNASALCDDGSCILPDGCTDMTACNYNASALCDDGSCILPDGCTDMTACNYNASALCDDSSCDYSCYGCMDTGACNYDVLATIDDGSCEFTSCICLGDFNGDNTVNVQDLLLLLASYGCSSNCVADLNNDGFVNASDMLVFLSVYGQTCN